MKKKTLAIVLVVCLLATALVSGTLAYFTDTDEVVENTFVVGGVEITQHELERTAKGTDEGTATTGEFTNDTQVILPSTLVEIPTGDENMHHEVVNGKRTAFVTEENGQNNVIDKIVQVQNTGTVPAYVGTIIAYEDTQAAAAKNAVKVTGGWTWKAMKVMVDGTEEFLQMEKDGVVYTLGCFVEASVIAPQGYATPALSQWMFKSTTTETDLTVFGTEYEILAASFGVQADGFTSADAAVEAAFGFKALSPSTAGGMKFEATELGLETLETLFPGYTLGYEVVTDGVSGFQAL